MSAVDPVLAKGVKLMLSSEPDAAEQLRGMLEEALRNKYGSSVKLPPLSPPRESPKEERVVASAHSTSEVDSPSPLPPAISDDSSGSASADLDDSFGMNFTELSCIVCGQFNVGARNQLMECSSCQHLFHQDCHDPPVKEMSSSIWECSECVRKNQPIVSSTTGGKPASFASISGGPAVMSPSLAYHKSLYKSSSSSSSSHKHSSKSSSGHSSHSSHSHSSHSGHSSHSSKRHSSHSHRSSSHHKGSSSSHRHSK